MGLTVDRSEFTDEEFDSAGIRLRENLAALHALLARPDFGTGEWSLGAELELAIIGDKAEALPLNRELLAAAVDPQVALELDRFNLEYNVTPVPAAGRPFSAMQAEISASLESLGAAASGIGGRVIPIGILPTLRMDELHTGWMTDLPRFHALCSGIGRIRPYPYRR